MKGLKAFIIIVGVVIFIGCSSQAKITHAVFEQPGATYSELNASLKELKETAYDSKDHEQFRTAKSLRHISKYSKDLGKRELAIRGLVFHANFSNDYTVINSCEDRLENILENDKNDPALKAAVFNYKKEIILGKLGWIELP